MPTAGETGDLVFALPHSASVGTHEFDSSSCVDAVAVSLTKPHLERADIHASDLTEM